MVDKEKRLAVAYLSKNPSEQPEASRVIFVKLSELDSQASNINSALQDAYSAAEKLEKELQKVIGGIDALAGLASEHIDPLKQKEWATKYLETTKHAQG
jgi:hypothetical protein